MDRCLIVIGCQKEKLDLIDKKVKNKILDFINSESHSYQAVVSIVRKKCNGDRNFRQSNDTIATDGPTYLDYESDTIIEVPGYDVDCSTFRRDMEYDIIGISTAASVLCIAMSMYSCGLNVRVLEPYCEDRKSKKLEDYAFEIMRAYMPGCVVK
jgi:hypothetical protein